MVDGIDHGVVAGGRLCQEGGQHGHERRDGALVEEQALEGEKTCSANAGLCIYTRNKASEPNCLK